MLRFSMGKMADRARPRRRAAPPGGSQRFSGGLAGRSGGLAAGLTVLLTAIAIAGCASRQPREVLAVEEGIEITLRGERDPPRAPPGPEFEQVTAGQIERSLQRLVVRYAELVIFVLTDPVPLLSDAHVETLGSTIFARLPALPPDQRLGFNFSDRYHGYEIDLEVYPEGPNLVYEFRRLMYLQREDQGRGGEGMNRAFIYRQPHQVVEGNPRTVIVKDPVRSAARPVFDRDAPESEEIF